VRLVPQARYWAAMVEESATPDLVELMRDTFEAVNRGDLDAVMKFFAPDAVWEAVSWVPASRACPRSVASLKIGSALTRTMRCSRTRSLTLAAEWCLS